MTENEENRTTESQEGELSLLVPMDPYRAIYAQGTAFVGKVHNEGYYLIHFEEPGNYSNVVTYEDRITHAAGRLVEKYPTSKMLLGPRLKWKNVGSVAYRPGVGWFISEIIDIDTLKEWDEGPHHAGGSPAFQEKITTKEINEAIRKGEWWKLWKR